MCPAHTLLLQNPVLTLHRSANMPKISCVYIIWIIHCRAHCRKPSKFSSSHLTSAFIFSSELYIFNMFSSKLFTQISLTIKTGGLYTIPALLAEIAYQDISLTLNRSWKVMLHEIISLRENLLSFYSPYWLFFFFLFYWDKTATNWFFVVLVSCSIFDSA